LTADDKHTRTRAIIRKLKRRFPDAGCSLTHRTPLQLLVSTILSAQCTDARVNIVTKDLFKRYKTAKDYAAADPDELAEIIRSTGFFRNKTKSILGMARALLENHGGKVPQTMEELVRLTNRLKLTRNKDAVKIERDLMRIVPKKEWTLFPHLMIEHGRATCQARKPQCEECPINTLCPSSPA
jgi:endonuclease-3